MLSGYDERQLDLIAERLRAEDPELARCLREGRPRRRDRSTSWPLLVLTLLGTAMLVAAPFVHPAVVVAVLGVALLCAAAVGYSSRRRRTRGPRVRPLRRATR